MADRKANGAQCESGGSTTDEAGYKQILRRALNWLLTDKRPMDLGSVTPWNEVIAEKAYADTERMLLGRAGKKRVVGNRIVDEREAKVTERREVNERFDREMAQMFRELDAEVGDGKD